MKKLKSVAIIAMASIMLTTQLTGCSISDSEFESSKPDINSLTDSAVTGECYTSAECIMNDDFSDYDFNTEEYNTIKESGFVKVVDNPLSTFAADVDTGSYCNLRRIIKEEGSLTNIAGSIRTEEILNYFDYEVNDTSDVFTVQYETGTCPWNPSNDLLLMTFQSNDLGNTITNRGNNFVYLIDTSGSMDSVTKMPLVIESFKLLTNSLTDEDRVSIVTYSGDSKVWIEGSNDKEKICTILDDLITGGGTNGSGGIEAAYECAEKNFIENGNNRVIIASDGDMNLGVTSQSGLTDLITQKKESGVFLTVLGYGSGNYSDANMESIADAGNGNYYYIDCLDEANRVLVEKLKQTTVTVAKDVKFQAEFNPAIVDSYRQIGYENRQISASDFEDDTKDGGEIGAGQQITIAYEIEYTDSVQISNLKYQTSELTEAANSGEVCTVSVRYKDPFEDKSKEIEYPIIRTDIANSKDFNFAVGIIETSMIIRDSEYKGNSNYDLAYSYALMGADEDKYRNEFCQLLVKLGAKQVDVTKVPETDSSETGEDDELITISYIIQYDDLNFVNKQLASVASPENFNGTLVSVSKLDNSINVTAKFNSESDSSAFYQKLYKAFLDENQNPIEGFNGIEF